MTDAVPNKDDEAQELYAAWSSRRDRKALARLLELKLPFVYRVASRFLCNSHDAEDVTQQVLLRLCATPSPSINDLDRWLYVAVARAARDYVRGARNRRVREEQHMNSDGGHRQPADDLERQETNASLHAALKELPQPLREAVVLHYMEALPRAVVSQLLDVPESTLRLRLESALAKLQGLLGARGVTVPGAALVVALGALPAPQASASFVAQVTAATNSASAAASAGVATAKAATAGFLAKGAMAAALVLAAGIGIAMRPHGPGVPDGVTAAAGEAKEEQPRGPLTFSYEMPRDAEVSLGVFGRDGKLLRSLVRAEFRRAGKNTESWDGRDQYGAPLAAGEYLIKALYHDAIGTEHVLTLGNPGTPPWPTADGKGDWLSDEAPPQAAVTDGKWVFLAAPGCEKGWAIMAVDESGRRQWGVVEDLYPRCVSLALSGDFLYVMFSGPELTDKSNRFNGKNADTRVLLVCLDKRTGAAARFTKTTPKLKIATFPYTENMVGLWELRNNKSFEPGVYAGQPRYADIDFGDTSHALGLAATSSTVYVAIYPDNALLAFDAATGAPKKDLDIPLEKPVGLHALSDDTLLAVSSGKVVSVNIKTKAATALISAGLSAPHSLTTDRNGNIFVSDWKDSFQVKVFSPRGEPLHAIGKPGGRPWLGKWEKNGMLVPRGVAVTDAGELWVAEDDTCPPRISVWNAKSGEFVKDYIGPTPYGGGSMFWVEPNDPTIVHTLGTRFKVDWKKKTYEPLATEIRRMSMEQPFAPNGHDIFGLGFRTFSRDGKDYVVITSSRLVVVLMKKEDVFVPVAALGGLHRWATDDGTGRTQWDSDIGTHMIKKFYPAFFRGHSGDNFSWCDRNGDGLVQADEMTWVKTIFRFDPYAKGRQPEFLSGWGMGIAPDWSIFFYGFCKEKHVINRADPKGWMDAGAPIYDLASANEIAALDFGVDGLYVTNENRLFVTGALEWPLGSREFPPRLPDALTCLDRDGKHVWSLAGIKEQTATDVVASNVIGEYTIPGIGSVICSWQWHGNYRPYFVSADGLYIGTTLDEGRSGPAGLWDESVRYFYQGQDGVPYVVNGANDAHHFLKLTGLEKCGRFETKLTISEADAKLAAATPPASAPKRAVKPVVSARWLDTPPKIDGDLSDWEMNYGASLDGGEKRSATVALGRDADTLYLAYHVVDDTPLLNKGGNWQTLFITGDCVDLMLATDRKLNPNRSAAAAGDIRLLLTSFQDAPIAVLYRPVAPGTSAAPVQLMAAKLDRIERLSDARVAFKRGDGFYDIEAAVPFAALGLDPADTAALRGDIGVIYSDATGRDRIKRVYYYNRRTQITADLTTEATLQPAEWGVIHMPLGKNLLRDGGFEGAFAKKAEEGWVIEYSNNGYAAELSKENSHSGSHALRLKQTVPVAFSEESFKLPDFGAFRKSANGGKGCGEVSVCQKVPVTGGKKYCLRFYFRAEGLKQEAQAPGKNRGGSSLGPWVYWVGGERGHVWVSNEQRDTDGWVERRDAMFNYYGPPKHYTAPAGAKIAVIAFKASVFAPDNQPTISIDDVEFVEMKDD